ncbi:pimeloyl-ACP methyl ester esterase BioJ [Francisella sp. Scap27]|uniref:pimeloyl-ACP methyl ester esterase BioJ n=1 Tax=Francisella sp. Scap27 TaxID=2589986 RepID=UPI0015BFFEB4|nr:pimeloyl-ACP methyl ester esterase BioJ [Francisella sp. Scap27]QLE78420.1 pimeloyl-ACP methyl ester esterase BioJ [Francisella sp. Scap27]
MTYHPSLEAILDTLEIRQIKNLPFPQQREIFEKITMEQIQNIPKSDITTKDIALDKDVFIRHYKPTSKSSNKAIFFIHGGGWCVSSVDTYDNVCRYLCDNSSLDVFSLEYRLAPEAPFPAAVEDSLKGYDWLYANAKNFDVDHKEIFIMGDSAGGNLATIVCHERQQTMPKAQILVYPATDKYTSYKSHKKYDAYKYHLNMKWSKKFINAYVPQAKGDREFFKNPQISPLFYKDTKQPDTLLIAATHDILIDGIYAYENKLRSEGVTVETHYDDEMFHGFIGSIGLSPLKNAEVALNKAIDFINQR